MRYRVAGPHEVLGHLPGEMFEADLDPVTEARLVLGGHIERVAAYSFVPRREDEEDEVSTDEA